MTRPTVYVADRRAHRNGNLYHRYGWGRMWSHDYIKKIDPDEPCGFDNGAYNAWMKRTTFPRDRFLRRIEYAFDEGITPTLAVLPDIVTGGRRSLDLSFWWFHHGDLPDWWPWYLAVQNGIDPDHLPDDMGEIAGIFLGGDDHYKGTAHVWRRWTSERGLRFHYGRCSRVRRVEAAIRIGADSLDSLTMSPFKWHEPYARYIVELLTGEAEPHPTLFDRKEAG